LPAIVTSGEGNLAILAQDITHADYHVINPDVDLETPAAQLTGLTPYSFAAGSLPVIYDNQVPVNLMLGSFGSEVVLLTEAAERSKSMIVGSSENLSAQAIWPLRLKSRWLGKSFS